jgi:hypothetical protein
MEGYEIGHSHKGKGEAEEGQAEENDLQINLGPW